MARRFHKLTQTAAIAALFALAPGFHTAGAAPAPSPSPEPPHPTPAHFSPTPTPVPPTLTAAPTPSSTPTAQSSPSAKPKPLKPDEWTEARRLFEQLSPVQKKKFLDNLNQWNNMPPEARELFRDKEAFRREKIAQEIQDAINKSGLRLDDDQREVYALRYTQERRKIEDTRRSETDRKRQSMIGEMLTHLKVEFATSPPPPAKPTASPAVK